MIGDKVREGYIVRQTNPHGVFPDPYFNNREFIFEDEEEAQHVFAQRSKEISNLNIFKVIETLTFPNGREKQIVEIIELIK